MNQNKPLITIVTVTFNAEQYLERTIKSVLEQDYKNIEYIIIDGNSKDKTIDIIKKYEKDIDYWISEEDSGIYDAMNKAINKATGVWINFMNAGDSLSSKEILSNIFSKKQNTDILFSDTFIVNQKNEILRKAKVTELNTFYIPQMPFIHQSTFIKTSLMKKFLYNDNYKLAADLDFFIKVYTKGYKFKYLQDLVISNFLLGGLHTNNMVTYTSEAIHSLNQYHPNIKEYNNNLGSIKALNPFNNEAEKIFPTILSQGLLKIEGIMNKYNKVIFYGYGTFSKLLAYKYSKSIIAIIDKKQQNSDFNLIKLEDLNNYDYDIILITLPGREKEIKKDLLNNSVNMDKIITPFN